MTFARGIILLVLLNLSACGESYHDPYGNEITKAQHERRVADDAAHDALINLMADCKARPHDGCPASSSAN